MYETILLWAGVAIIVGVAFLLVKQVETRLVLLGAGLLMCCLAGVPMKGFAAFSERMVTAGLVQVILSVMGFAYVMKMTKCDAHLVNLLVGGMSKIRIILVPATVIITAFINISLTSAAGVSAAVGSILIPLMISLGVHPAMAASAVMAGTFGSMVSPGLSHNAFISSKLVPDMDVMQVIAVHYSADIVTVIIGAISLAILAVILKENNGYVPEAGHETASIEKPNVLYAIIPIIPVFLLIFSASISSATAPEWGKSVVAAIPALNKLSVPAAMLIGAILGMLVTRANPTNAVKEFFNGMGNAYGSVMGIIIAAAVFVAGLQAVGLVDAFNSFLKQSDAIAKWAATFGPFALAVIMGSGDAATLAFNEAVSPHAQQFGLEVVNMASLATLSGALGRTMSPLAGAAIICAGLAGVNPLEIAKRNALGMIIAAVVAMLMLT